MAAFFSKIIIFLHCFALASSYPNISQAFLSYDSLSLSFISAHLTLSFPHSLTERKSAEKNESCGDTKSCICCITFFVLTEKFRVSSPLPICPLVRLFSLFYDCAPVAVSPCHHGNLLSLLLATHTVCVSVCSVVTPRYLYSQSATQECVWVFVCCCVFSGHVWRAPYLWALEIHIVRLFFHSHIHSNIHLLRRCRIRAAAYRAVWSLAWELGRIRQAAAVWYSCHPLPTAGVARHSLKFNQSPLALKPWSTSMPNSMPPHPFSHMSLTHSTATEKCSPKPRPPNLNTCPFVLCCSHRSITQHSS